MFAEEFVVLDPDAALWQPMRPLLTIALNIEQQPDFVWHGWDKPQIVAFLAGLPTHCSIVVGVWSTDDAERDVLRLGFVCEVQNAHVSSVRTFEALKDDDMPSIQELEPGAEHALAIMRYARAHVAPVAWALFTDEATWHDWIYTNTIESNEHISAFDKGTLLMTFAREGRCVLMGSQVRHHE